MAELTHSDRADLPTFVGLICGDREIEIKAADGGLLIDDVLTVSWDWILAAYRASAPLSDVLLEKSKMLEADGVQSRSFSEPLRET
jgi:hypothetical protein